jgi:hypothetical protein
MTNTIARYTLWLLAGTLVVTPPASAQDPPAEPKVSVALLKLAGESLRETDTVVLDRTVADLVGEARNGAHKQYIAFARLTTGTRSTMSRPASLEPGGMFRISGIQFAGTGTFELVVGVFPSEHRFTPGSIDEDWRQRAEAVSNRITVVIGRTEGGTDAEQEEVSTSPSLDVVSVGAVTLRQGEKNPIPAAGDVIVRSAALPEGWSVYLSKRIPYTDQCFVLGPARRGPPRGRHVIPGVIFDAPGDPQQMHFGLAALASSRPLKTGRVSCETTLYLDGAASSSVDVIVGSPNLLTDNQRVAYLAVTRIGVYTLPVDQDLPKMLTVRSGTPIEVSEFDRVIEGARLYFLTREVGSRLWFAQGPAIKRGTMASRDGRTGVTWIWLDLRFHTREQSDAPREFEIVAVLSASLYPNAVVDSTFPGSRSVHGISRVIRVRVQGATTPPVVPAAITRVGVSDARAGVGPLTVGASGPVVIDTPQTLPDGMNVFVVRHKLGGATYSLFETLDQQSRRIVPDLSFINPHPEEGAEYQLFAIKVWGRPAVTEVSYEDLLNLSVGTSDVVSVRYSGGALQAWRHAVQPWLDEANKEGSVWNWMALLVIVGLVAAVAVLVVALARSRSARQEIRLPSDRASRRARFWYLWLGVGLLILVVHVIRRYYLDVYATAIHIVMNMPDQHSLGLAVWLVTITSLLGVALHLAHEYAQAYHAAGDELRATFFHKVVRTCAAAAVVLWLFQGGLYFEMLSSESYGVISLLGGIAFTLIAFAETIVFFFISKLTLPPVDVGRELALRNTTHD